MTKDEALKLALEALEKSTRYFNIVRLGESQLKDSEIRGDSHKAITAIKEALAQPAQKFNRQAFLDWYDNAHWGNEDFKQGCERAWEAALAQAAQPAQEPVALVIDGVLVKSALPAKYTGHLYTAPPQPAQEPDRQALQANGTHPAPCARHCEAQAFKVEIRNLKKRLEHKPMHPELQKMYEDFFDKCFRESSAAQPAQEPVAWISAVTGCLTAHDMSHTVSWAPLYATTPQRPWVGLMRGVRVEGDTVIISIKGGNDAARELCGALIKEMEA